nr:unnamed protein product [Digitaria exilis]
MHAATAMPAPSSSLAARGRQPWVRDSVGRKPAAAPRRRTHCATAQACRDAALHSAGAPPLGAQAGKGKPWVRSRRGRWGPGRQGQAMGTQPERTLVAGEEEALDELVAGEEEALDESTRRGSTRK